VPRGRFTANLRILDVKPTFQSESARGDIRHSTITGGMGISRHLSRRHKLGQERGRLLVTVTTDTAHIFQSREAPFHEASATR
jgi:hypothetical protein